MNEEIVLNNSEFLILVKEIEKEELFGIGPFVKLAQHNKININNIGAQFISLVYQKLQEPLRVKNSQNEWKKLEKYRNRSEIK